MCAGNSKPGDGDDGDRGWSERGTRGEPQPTESVQGTAALEKETDAREEPPPPAYLDYNAQLILPMSYKST
ncbi:hypothetical protein NHX12_020927 [Muraenolepis orangiensis]|uniref:Uncharacterized protein n=1 Tax=Muraenolepis orangiensis TaxID=630683 RepID=A0A9Q0EXX2_9TELE|nr:hypothetical protein NHX12_020927 [Muraenolepis orangiensis]